MSKLNSVVDKILDAGLALSVAIVFVVTFLQVISRFVFKLGIPWSTDIIRLAFVYTVFLGAALGMREKGHLNVDVVFNALPERTRNIVGIGINMLLLGFFVFLFVLGMQFTQTGLTQGAPYVQMPMSVYYFSVPLSALLMFYYLIQHMVEQFKQLKAKS
ncbi:TRAP transporter small permease [Clostridiaceae bacterium 35-E11]